MHYPICMSVTSQKILALGEMYNKTVGQFNETQQSKFSLKPMIINIKEKKLTAVTQEGHLIVPAGIFSHGIIPSLAEKPLIEQAGHTWLVSVRPMGPNSTTLDIHHLTPRAEPLATLALEWYHYDEDDDNDDTVGSTLTCPSIARFTSSTEG